jgi:glycosyltransferase involved in cell wall biosynthesis
MSDLIPSARKIVVNLRSQGACLTGVQRYSQELCARLNGGIETVMPRRPLHGVAGHLWEQTVLPVRAGKRLLWSPANTGPVTVERQVLTIHDVASLDHPEWFGSKFATWYGWMIPALAKRVRCLITVSEFSKQRLVANTGIKESRVHVIPNGVDERFYPRNIEDIREVRTRLRIPTNQYVLVLGSIEPRKNLSRLLQAWELDVQRLPNDVWLVIAGAEGNSHIFASNKLGRIPARVHSTGFVSDQDLPALYSGALAMVYPSIYEGFGLPVLEAMAAGTAAIAGNSTSLPEVAGDAGVLVNPCDVDAIAVAIERIVRDGVWRERLRKRGIERSRQFTWDRAAASTLRVLESASAS